MFGMLNFAVGAILFIGGEVIFRVWRRKTPVLIAPLTKE